jgi:hypothetical protein
VIGTVVVSYKRPDLLRQTLTSYLETVTGRYRLLVVDNGGCDEALDVVSRLGVTVMALDSNYYPGDATNRGWDWLAELEPDYLHRSDNDVQFLPGWCDEINRRFEQNPNLGQLGLRTLEEEGAHPNVGGNCVVPLRVFREVRWREEGWAPGSPTEDYFFSADVLLAGYEWARVETPCIVHHGNGSPQTDPYYAETWAAKGYR